jgi:hypothetical protein
MYFGKGFSVIGDFLQLSLNKTYKKVDFSVKMFSKQLYGRVQT